MELLQCVSCGYLSFNISDDGVHCARCTTHYTKEIMQEKIHDINENLKFDPEDSEDCHLLMEEK